MANILALRARPALAIDSIEALIAAKIPAAGFEPYALKIRSTYPGLKLDVILSQAGALAKQVQDDSYIAAIMNGAEWASAKADGTACGLTVIGTKQ